MGAKASQATSLAIVYSTVYSDADQGKHQSSASLAFVRRIHRGPVNSPHKWPITRNMFPFDDVIMDAYQLYAAEYQVLILGSHYDLSPARHQAIRTNTSALAIKPRGTKVPVILIKININYIWFKMSLQMVAKYRPCWSGLSVFTIHLPLIVFEKW